MSKAKGFLLAAAVAAMVFFLSCSEDLKPIEPVTWEGTNLSSSGETESSSSSGEGTNLSSSGNAANPSSSSEAANPSSSGEEQKPAVSGVSQKGPFQNNSSVTLYELDGNLVQTGRSFHGTTDNKGSFEIKGIELASPYALLKADGFYRNEVTGGNSSAPITLYAIADMSNKSNANVNILTHLEYYRVQTLVQKGKSLAAAKRQALGEILAVFSIDGNNFKDSEDMSIFGTGDSDAALLAISILLQGELSEGSFLALLADFSQKLKDSGVWDNKTMKAEMADWALSADLVAIRGNIANWGLSPDIPDFEKYIRSYAAANSGTGGCIGLDSGNEFCHNGHAYPKCGDVDGLGKYEYNPDTQFCHNNYTVAKCNGMVYEPPGERCNIGVIEKQCGANWYDPSKYYCYNGSDLRSCGNPPLPYNPVTQFCELAVIYDKCGGTVTFAPGAEDCCGNGKYTIATQFCYSSAVHSKCGGNDYNPTTHFCLGSAITPLCGGQAFTGSQFCSGNTVYGKCGSTVTFAPGTEACCGNSKYDLATHSCHNGQTYSCGNLPYDPATQFCSGNTVYGKCGGTVTFAPGTEACCGNNKYDLATHSCHNGQTYSCGNLPYDPATHSCYNGQTYSCGNLPYDPATQFCSGNTVYGKCGGTVTFAPGTEACCGNNKYTLATHSCYNGQTYSCGNQPYNPSTHFCLGSAVTPLCGGQTYTSSQFCSGNTVHDKCGGTLTFTPGTEDCCGNDKYTLVTQFCSGSPGSIYNKCGGNEYNPSTHFCLGSAVTPLCGGQTYTSSQFCSGNAVHDKCGGTVTFFPGTEQCCGSNKYTLASQFCSGSPGSIYDKCGGSNYDPQTQLCSNGSIKTGGKCGPRTDLFDPDLYECREVSKIYLKTPVNYGGKNYEAVLIGTQTWMAENLNYNASGSRCHGDNTGGDSQNRCGTYGRLYNWATAMNNSASSAAVPSGVRGICPSGWHIPSNDEWDVLITAVGGFNTAGTKLKAALGWNSNGNGTDEYGFSALPGGSGDSGGGFINVGGNGFWWSSTENGSTENGSNLAFSRYMNYNGNYVSTLSESSLLSVRCVQD